MSNKRKLKGRSRPNKDRTKLRGWKTRDGKARAARLQAEWMEQESKRLREIRRQEAET